MSLTEEKKIKKKRRRETYRQEGREWRVFRGVGQAWAR